MQTSTPSAAIPRAPAAASRTLAGLFALGFGVFLLWGVGFARNDLLHNAAHDTRHSNGFPCH